MKQTCVLVSVSGGKDSTATLLVAKELRDLDPSTDIKAVFCDTGNEHEWTYEYVDYLQDATGVEIVWLKADFTKQIERRREKLQRIVDGETDEEVFRRDNKYKFTADSAARALTVMQATGNPMLDQATARGTFATSQRKFCTQETKAEQADLYIAKLLNEYEHVESWRGVRKDESAKRSNYAPSEWGPRISIHLPIFYWSAERVFEQHRKHGIKWNPLYEQGMSRVGCMPCIFSSKQELKNIANRFPRHIDRIEEWEKKVSRAARDGTASFFAKNLDGSWVPGIRRVVEWSKTSHGGRQQDMFADHGATICSSEYGLCE